MKVIVPVKDRQPRVLGSVHYFVHILNAMDLSWLKTTLVIWKMKSRKSHGTCKSEEKEKYEILQRKLKVKLNRE